MGLIAAAATLFGCARAGEKGTDGIGSRADINKSGIVYFEYRYNGSIGGDSYRYEVDARDGSVIFSHERMDIPEYGKMSMELPADFLEKLDKLYLDNHLAEWDGYSKYNSDVLDGSGFSISIIFADGKSINAKGSNCVPEGYADFKKAMTELFKDMTEKLLEEGREKMIAQGVSGDLLSIMVCFNQHGSSGSDSYKFFIVRDSVRENNFDVEISSDGGDGIIEGEYLYYAALPDEAVDFDGVKALVEKYDVINWYNWDKASDDYDNSEWFQVFFRFEEGHISAMGTLHPENYDGFRAEFLKLMIDNIENAEKNYGLKQ